ncbi:hypothetical protein IKG49_01125 [Candidatus Saccharibacteria bacterium]|nr:hypothetical protein [Candidatus Saccharibacteria bacterium]
MKSRFVSFLLPSGMVGVAILVGGILTLPKAMADDSSVSTATITVPMACSMSSTTDTAHTAEVPNGIDSRGQDYYPDGIGQTTLKVYCNDNEGFSVYAVGYSDDTLGNTYLRDSTLGQTSDILTSTTFTGNTSAWAMKIGVTSGTYTPIIAGSTSDSEKQSGDTDYSNWAAVPSTYTRVSYRNSGTDVDNNSIYTEGASVTTTYAAYISPTQKAGTYIGQVKYTLVHPASEVPLQPQPTTAGQICYYPNGSKVEGTMGCQSVSSSVTLLASNFSREGYGFAGWSDKYDYSTGAHFYGPQETITLNTADYSGSNPGLSLYAVWVKSAGNLQDSSKVASLCGTGTDSLTQAPTDGTANLSSVSALTDQRDNETYAIAKLADGNCWMIENLRLADTHQEDANTVPTTLTTLNTNNPLNDNDPTNPTVTLKHNYTDTNTFTNLSSTSSVAYNADTAPDGWCGSISAVCFDQSRLRTDNTANRATNNPNTNSGSMYSYGNYYNWYSATAGNGTYSKSSGEAVGDLCPNGWKLPIGNTSTGDIEQGESDSANRVSSFSYLDRKMGGTGAYQSTAEASLRWRKYPNNYLYSGFVGGERLSSRGTNSGYWSSTAYSSNIAYDLRLSSADVNPVTPLDNKYFGRTVRCVAQ